MPHDPEFVLRPRPGLYLVIVGSWFAVLTLAFLSSAQGRSIFTFLWPLAAAVALSAWLVSLRITITGEKITFRRLFYRTYSIRRSDVQAAEIGAFQLLITPIKPTNWDPFIFPIAPFSRLDQECVANFFGDRLVTPTDSTQPKGGTRGWLGQVHLLSRAHKTPATPSSRPIAGTIIGVIALMVGAVLGYIGLVRVQSGNPSAHIFVAAAILTLGSAHRLFRLARWYWSRR